MTEVEGVAASRARSAPLVILLATLFVTAAAASNWAIQHIGHDNGAARPRTIPIGWGMAAPSGVLLVGVMISVRDALHEQVGLRGTLLAILIGSAMSSLLAGPALAVASGVTMLVAESADALVYQHLRRRGRMLAAAGSNIVSSLLDSAVFLLIAYGVNVAAHGAFALTIGKIEASLLVIVAWGLMSRARPSVREGNHASIR